MKSFFIFIIIFSAASCKNISNGENFTAQQKKDVTLQYDSMQQEIKLYLTHAKQCKNEYEVVSYEDSLPFMRKNEIKQCGSEKKWHEHLEWLKTHGSQEIQFDTNGIPMFNRKERSPYNGH